MNYVIRYVKGIIFFNDHKGGLMIKRQIGKQKPITQRKTKSVKSGHRKVSREKKSLLSELHNRSVANQAMEDDRRRAAAIRSMTGWV